jgi:superfamily I DNA/RNA helicase
MTTRVTSILQRSEYLSDADFITLCLATNAACKNFIVIEALAGTGKTTLLLDVIRRLDLKRCLVLSFSRNAIRVIKVRLKKQTGDWIQSQTFDSLFLHLHGKKAKLAHQEPTFQTYRDMVVETTREDIQDFVCRTKEVNYAFSDFDYVFSDEAQVIPSDIACFSNPPKTMLVD